MLIRKATKEDAAALADIYNYYIENTIITFEMDNISADEMLDRVNKIQEKYEWLVLEDEGELKGYAYYGQFRTRVAYDATIESTVYLKHGAQGHGYGRMLYNAIIEHAKKNNFRELIGGIALPNDESEQLHIKTGFEKVAHFKKVGYKFDQWIDVVFYQRPLYD